MSLADYFKKPRFSTVAQISISGLSETYLSNLLSTERTKSLSDAVAKPVGLNCVPVLRGNKAELVVFANHATKEDFQEQVKCFVKDAIYPDTRRDSRHWTYNLALDIEPEPTLRVWQQAIFSSNPTTLSK